MKELEESSSGLLTPVATRRPPQPIWTFALGLALVVALVETVPVAVFYQDLPVHRDLSFLLFYASLVALSVAFAVALPAVLVNRMAGGTSQPLPNAIGSCFGFLLLLLLRLSWVVETYGRPLSVMVGPVAIIGIVCFLLAVGVGVIAYRSSRRMLRLRSAPTVLVALTIVGMSTLLIRPSDEVSVPPSRASIPDSVEEPPLLKGANLVVITVDTLRIDHLPWFGYERDTAPGLGFLEEQGLLIEAITQRSQTAPSLATLLTGTYPPSHGLLDNRDQLADSNTVLAEILRDNGYRTIAANDSPAVAPTFNFHQGFDRFLMPRAVNHIVGSEIEGSRGLNDLILPTLDQVSDTPFFLWAHYKDPHRPYVVPKDYRYLYDEGTFQGDETIPVALPFGGLESQEPDYRRRDLSWAVAQYDAEIRYNMDSIAELLENLENRGLLDDTLLVLTADHGESLGEHGVYFRHRTAYGTDVRTPLVIHHRPKLLAGRKLDTIVSLVDVVPTLLDLLGIAKPSSLEGQSFIGELVGDSGRYARQNHFILAGWHVGYHTHAVRTSNSSLMFVVNRSWVYYDALVERLARWWIRDPSFPLVRCRKIEREFYDLTVDPDELINLAGQGWETQARLESVLWDWIDQQYSREAADSRIDIPPEEEAALQALGYAK